VKEDKQVRTEPNNSDFVFPAKQVVARLETAEIKNKGYASVQPITPVMPGS
jgi:predicted ATPase with chaperone activity